MEKPVTKNILLVDDQQTFLELLSEQLGECGHSFCILTAPNGHGALKALESTPVDLVVTDLRMPGMDGVDLVSSMKRSYPAIPVMVMSAHLYPELERKLRGLGVSRIIDKSFLGHGTLEKMINDVFSGN